MNWQFDDDDDDYDDDDDDDDDFRWNIKISRRTYT